MPLFKNHVEIATALRNDVDKAPIKSKRLKLRTLLAKFGYSKRSDANTAMITQNLNDAVIGDVYAGVVIPEDRVEI